MPAFFRAVFSAQHPSRASNLSLSSPSPSFFLFFALSRSWLHGRGHGGCNKMARVYNCARNPQVIAPPALTRFGCSIYVSPGVHTRETHIRAHIYRNKNSLVARRAFPSSRSPFPSLAPLPTTLISSPSLPPRVARSRTFANILVCPGFPPLWLDDNRERPNSDERARGPKPRAAATRRTKNTLLEHTVTARRAHSARGSPQPKVHSQSDRWACFLYFFHNFMSFAFSWNCFAIAEREFDRKIRRYRAGTMWRK